MQLEEIIKKFDLLPHPEGGFYKETYRSSEIFNERNLTTCIYFLLPSGHKSHFHRIKSDEHWFFHAGSPLIVHTLDEKGHTENIIGNDLTSGFEPYFMVPKNTIFGSTVSEENSFSFVSCVVSPGFDFQDFELLQKQELIEDFPNNKEIINYLSIN